MTLAARACHPRSCVERVSVDRLSAGPIFMHTPSGRGRTSLKCYMAKSIAIFGQLATRAVHSELVYDYLVFSFNF